MKKVLLRCLSIFLSMVLVFQTVPVSRALVDSLAVEAENIMTEYEEDNDTQKHILYERVQDRTAFTKTFIQSDGTKLIAQYESAVHFENEQGELVDYDNSLSETEADVSGIDEASLSEPTEEASAEKRIYNKAI